MVYQTKVIGIRLVLSALLAHWDRRVINFVESGKNCPAVWHAYAVSIAALKACCWQASLCVPVVLHVYFDGRLVVLLDGPWQ